MQSVHDQRPSLIWKEGHVYLSAQIGTPTSRRTGTSHLPLNMIRMYLISIVCISADNPSARIGTLRNSLPYVEERTRQRTSLFCDEDYLAFISPLLFLSPDNGGPTVIFALYNTDPCRGRKRLAYLDGAACNSQCPRMPLFLILCLTVDTAVSGTTFARLGSWLHHMYRAINRFSDLDGWLIAVFCLYWRLYQFRRLATILYVLRPLELLFSAFGSVHPPITLTLTLTVSPPITRPSLLAGIFLHCLISLHHCHIQVGILP